MHSLKIFITTFEISSSYIVHEEMAIGISWYAVGNTTRISILDSLLRKTWLL